MHTSNRQVGRGALAALGLVFAAVAGVGCAQHDPPQPGGTAFRAAAPTGVVAALPEDVFKGIKRLATACEANDISACNRLAHAYHHGAAAPVPMHKPGHPDPVHTGTPPWGADLAQNTERAASLYDTACARGWMTACVARAELHLTGASRDTAAAGALVQRACLDFDDATGCLVLAAGLQAGFVNNPQLSPQTILDRQCNAGVVQACQMLRPRG